MRYNSVWEAVRLLMVLAPLISGATKSNMIGKFMESTERSSFPSAASLRRFPFDPIIPLSLAYFASLSVVPVFGLSSCLGASIIS